MQTTKKYLIASSAIFAICLAVFIFSSALTREFSGFVLNIIQIFGVSSACILCIICSLKNPDVLIYKVLRLVLLCYFLGEIYWTLHYFVRGFYTFGDFTISDIPYIGIFIFLIAINYGILYVGIPKDNKTGIKNKIIPTIAFLTVIAVGLVSYYQGAGTAAVIIYTAVLSVTIYFAVLLLTIRSKNSAGSLKIFQICVILHCFAAAVWLMPFVTNSGVLFVAIELLLTAIPLAYVPAVVYGVEKWQIF